MAFSCVELSDFEPEAVTIRPEIAREQAAHVAVGTPAREAWLSHGTLEEGFVGERLAGTEEAGRGNGRDFCSFERPNTSIEGCSGLPDTEIIGVVGLYGNLIH